MAVKATQTLGRTTFMLAAARSLRLPFVAEVTCVNCGGAVFVAYGEIVPTFRVGNEVVGVCCDSCLDQESREKLALVRQRQGRA